VGQAQLHGELDLLRPKQIERAVEQLELIGVMHQEATRSVAEVLTLREIDVRQPLGQFVDLAGAYCDASLAQKAPKVQQVS
jgi:hypothetical protein